MLMMRLNGILRKIKTCIGCIIVFAMQNLVDGSFVENVMREYIGIKYESEYILNTANIPRILNNR